MIKLAQFAILSAFASLSCFLALSGRAEGQAYNVLHQFVGYPTDGAWPSGGVVRDASGNIYGATLEGGANYCQYSSYGGCGTIYKVAPDGTETILYSFGSGVGDGIIPEAAPVIDGSGNFYGTTGGGGAYQCGTVFKLAPGGTETILHSFSGGSDGCLPDLALTMDAAGNFYGATLAGGNDSCQHLNGGGCGTIFKIASDGTESIIADLTKISGWHIPSPLIVDKNGSIYGVAEQRRNEKGNGVVFKITPGGKMHVIHQFAGYPNDGSDPAYLIVGKDGGMFGTTYLGGSDNWGTVFRLDSNGTESVLYNFQDGADGYEPDTLIEDGKGALFGLAGSGYGLLYSLSEGGDQKVLYNFGADGWGANGKIVRDKAGTIYGALSVGGVDCELFGCGVVYSFGK